MNTLKKLLEELYSSSDSARYIKNDPIEYPRSYKKREDIEIAGLISSSLAYGRVDLFKPVIGKILESARTEGLYRYIYDLDVKQEKERLTDLKYRMNTSNDLVCFLYLIKSVIRKYGSIENLFIDSYRIEGGSLKKTLERFVFSILEFDTSIVYGNNIRPRGLEFLLPSPSRGSACKRLNMFLRWMVRPDDGVDFGLWDIPADKLVIPVDTHIAFICRTLGLTDRKTVSWKTAEKITNRLKEFDAADPVKFDFALCHTGISDDCKHKKATACSICRLADFCIINHG